MSAAVARPVLRYHGGKFRLAPRLIELFPLHRVYTEAYGGGASVLMQKPRCYSEIYNDLDREVVNVFRVLQNRKQAARLEALLRVTPFARAEFELSYKHTRSDVERARRTIIRSFMGWGSDSISRLKATRAGFNTRISSTMSTGFRWNSNRSGTTAASDWRGYPNYISAFVDRLQGVTIENRDAKIIFDKMDRKDALHYVDPPYPIHTRRIGNGTTLEHRYRYEMKDADHEELSSLLHALKGMVIISSYPGPLYERLLPRLAYHFMDRRAILLVQWKPAAENRSRLDERSGVQILPDSEALVMTVRDGMPNICKPCWERYGRRSEVFRLGMCRNCWSGKTGATEEQAEFRARQAAAVKRNWKDPEFRARNAAAVKRSLTKRWKDPECRARHAAAVKRSLTKRWKDPEFRARQAAAVKRKGHPK